MCFMRKTIAYLCLNMINFDAVDFSERRSEEVISFFDARLGVYCPAVTLLLFPSSNDSEQ